MANHCYTHNRDYENSCPECRHDETVENLEGIIEGLSELSRGREEGFEDLKMHLNEVTYRQANPGDHECPGCRFITLKMNAKRCPKCHTDVDNSYWVEVAARMKAAAEAAEKRRKAAQEENERIRRQEERKRRQEKAEADYKLRQWQKEEKRRKDSTMTALFLALLLLLVATMGVVFALRFMAQDCLKPGHFTEKWYCH